MDEIKVGDRVQYVKPRHSGPSRCYGTIERVPTDGGWPYYVKWDEGKQPYGSEWRAGYYRRSEIALVTPIVPKEGAMDEQQRREIRERAFYLNSVDDGGVQRCADDIYDLLAALAAREGEITRLRDEVIWADHIREEREDDLRSLRARLGAMETEVTRYRTTLERCRAECEGIDIGVMGLIGRITSAVLDASPSDDGTQNKETQ